MELPVELEQEIFEAAASSGDIEFFVNLPLVSRTVKHWTERLLYQRLSSQDVWNNFWDVHDKQHRLYPLVDTLDLITISSHPKNYLNLLLVTSVFPNLSHLAISSTPGFTKSEYSLLHNLAGRTKFTSLYLLNSYHLSYDLTQAQRPPKFLYLTHLYLQSPLQEWANVFSPRELSIPIDCFPVLTHVAFEVNDDLPTSGCHDSSTPWLSIPSLCHLVLLFQGFENTQAWDVYKHFMITHPDEHDERVICLLFLDKPNRTTFRMMEETWERAERDDEQQKIL